MTAGTSPFMPIMFNTILAEADIPLRDVRLLRHKDHRAVKGRSPYELWRDDRPKFEVYQATQHPKNRQKLMAEFWASFVGTPAQESLFVGLYQVEYLGPLKHDQPKPHMDGIDKAGGMDEFRIEPDPRFSDLDGKLIVEWGKAWRTWIQRADRQNKQITELRTAFKEPEFPGFLNFVEPLSRIELLPATWIPALKSCGGVYLLTCPKTKEQYVGKADGAGGFLGRWNCYLGNGHGGNVGLQSKEPSDYQVAILEVAGTAATPDEILAMESKWKRKLQSKEMGLNRN
jgi:hypothetical protein